MFCLPFSWEVVYNPLDCQCISGYSGYFFLQGSSSQMLVSASVAFVKIEDLEELLFIKVTSINIYRIRNQHWEFFKLIDLKIMMINPLNVTVYNILWSILPQTKYICEKCIIVLHFLHISLMSGLTYSGLSYLCWCSVCDTLS